MSNPFLITETKYNRDEQVLDLHAFAVALAKALKGKIIRHDADSIANDRYVSIEIEGAILGLTKGWKKSELEKVEVRIGPIGLKLGYNDTPRGDEYKTPEASVSTGRPMDKIVADITRRVIEPGKAPIAKLHEHAATCNQQANELLATAERFRKRDPNMKITVKDGERFSAGLYRNVTGQPYLSGNIRSDGSVTLDHLSLSAEQFERFYAAIFPKKTK